MGVVMQYPFDLSPLGEELGRLTDNSEAVERADRENSLSGISAKPCIYIEEAPESGLTEKLFAHILFVCGLLFAGSLLFFHNPGLLDYALRLGCGILTGSLWIFYIKHNSWF